MPGSTRRAPRLTRPGSGRAAQPPGRGRSRPVAAGRRRAPAAVPALAGSRGRPGQSSSDTRCDDGRPASRDAGAASRRSTSAALCRGSRLVYGSWKHDLYFAAATAPVAPGAAGRDRSASQAEIVPLVGRSRPTIMRATRRLAGAGLADDGHRLAWLDGEADVVDRDEAAEFLASPVTASTGAPRSVMHHRQLAAQLAGPDAPRLAAVERRSTPVRRRGTLSRACGQRGANAHSTAGASNAESGRPGMARRRVGCPLDVRPRRGQGRRVRDVADRRAATRSCAPRRPGPRT